VIFAPFFVSMVCREFSVLVSIIIERQPKIVVTGLVPVIHAVVHI